MISENKDDLKNLAHTVIKYSYWHSLFAAGISGGAAGYLGFYFEGLKKRLQGNLEVPNFRSLGFRAWIKQSFRGAGTYALSSIPPSIVQQMTNHWFKKSNLSDTLGGKAIESLISGALGGIPAAAIGNILLEQQVNSIGPLTTLRNLFIHGPSRLFRGTSLLMIREAMFGFCYLQGISDAGNYASECFGQAFVLPSQLIVGAAGSLASHPFDTIATTMQRYDSYKKVKDAILYLWKENGIKAFYKGEAARVGLFSATMLTLNKVQTGVLNLLENEVINSISPVQEK